MMRQDRPTSPNPPGDAGSADARVVILQPGEGTSLRVLEETATFKVRLEDTGGRFSVVEIDTPPGGGTSQHRHEGAEEVLYVLEGAYEVEIDGRREELSAGGCALVPRGVVHGYANRSLGRARLLSVSTPAATEEVVFLELASHFAAGARGSAELAESLAVVAAARGLGVRE